MSDFSWTSLICGFLLGGAVALFVLANGVGDRDKDRIASGVFTYDGKAFLLLPIRNPAAALPPG